MPITGLAEYFTPDTPDVFATLGYVPTPRQAELHAAQEWDVLYGGSAGGGKGGRCPDRAAPSYNPEMETKVLTPKGFKLIGDIAVGDRVCNPDGSVAKVIVVTDNGPKQFFKVTLADGSCVEADEDHLWAISLAGSRKRRRHAPPVIPEGLRPEDEWNLRVQSRCHIVNTVELRELVLSANATSTKGGRARYPQVPLPNPLTMTGPQGRWSALSPYILGALIGDGALGGSSAMISGEDEEVFARIRAELPEHLELRRYKGDRCPSYGIARVAGTGSTAMALLARDGLKGLHSWEKFIPPRLLVAPVPERFAFVQGLMDTDGTMDSRGHVSFTTVSERLAVDMQGMLRSLGYRATMTKRVPTFTHKGEKRQGRLAFTLYIQGRHADRLFHVTRKKERVLRFNGGDVEPWHRVMAVEPSGIDNSRCIGVDNLNHLYVTDDYIVTHNTRALLMDALKRCVEHPGLTVACFRRTYGELDESLIAELARADFARALRTKWNGSKRDLNFANGSTIRFRYAESVDDATRRQGSEIQLLIVDERTQVSADVVGYLETRLRSGNPRIPVIGIRSGSNPGGVGHTHVKARFVDATDHGAKVVVDDRGRARRFIPARVSDNPHVNPEYVTDLQGIEDPNLRAALLDGSWDSFAGQVFGEWRFERHVVPPFTVPPAWPRYAGIDWGYAAPWAVVWGAVDEDRRVWVYRELYDTQVGETDQARRILEAEGVPLEGSRRGGEGVRLRLADPSMWNSRGEVHPIASVYFAAGCVITKATNDRLSGVQRVHSYLGEGPACRLHRAQGWVTCPRLHVFSTCTDLIRTLPGLPRDQAHPEDVDTSSEDHGYDALRYLLMQLGLPQRSHAKPRQPTTLEERVWADKARLAKPRRQVHPDLGRLV